MVQRAKKRTLFWMGVFITSLVGLVSGYVRTNYSKDNSLIPVAHADTTASDPSCAYPYSMVQCDVYFGLACFPEGTMISTPDGKKEIQQIMAGEMVYGFDVSTGETGVYPVVQTLKHSKDDAGMVVSPLLIITHEEGVITVTDNHWMYRKNGREGDYANFDRAGMLQVGDVLTLEDGTESKITKIEKGPAYDFVYNLEVEKVHTYLADGVRVHNYGAGGAGCCGGK